SIPVRLTSERLGRSWQEETQTRVISRHGASLGCNHPVEVGDQIELHRCDCTGSVKARVVWRQARAGGQFEIGLEFLHCDNFWDEDWHSAEPVFFDQEPHKPLVR
ncbi:MAG: PilZ domain-containing protein, partial [Candidatus Acidiferrales bacterium]